MDRESKRKTMQQRCGELFDELDVPLSEVDELDIPELASKKNHGSPGEIQIKVEYGRMMQNALDDLDQAR